MATTVRAHDADLPQLLERARAGEEVVLADGQTLVARLASIAAAPAETSESAAAVPAPRPERRPGLCAGQIIVGPEFFEPLPEEELRLWEGRGDE